jgi:ribonuclease Z
VTDKEFFTLQTPHFTIEGRSRAGHETFFRIRDLGLGFDIGRGPDALVHINDIFISHAHLDHAVGIPFYAGQRHLQRLDGGRIYVPAESAEDVRALLALHEKMAGTRFAEVEVIGVAVGDEIRAGRSHVVRAHQAAHRVAARAYEVIDVRDHRTSILFYTGDTDRGLLESCDALFKSEVLLIECSFVLDGHQDRAAKYRHIHLDDIADYADRFENELVILTHFSRRYSRDEIRDAVRRRLPHALRERIRLALPEPWQRA